VTGAFRHFEKAQWQRAAEPYDLHWSRLTGQAVPALLASLGLAPGAQLLDVACGPGHLAAAAAGQGAEVVAADFAAAMLARARALHAGLRLVRGDAERLPFASSSFEAVAMNFGILHLEAPEHAIEEAHRVLSPGGRVGFTAWRPDEGGVFASVLEAVRRHGRPVELPAGPAFFGFGDPAQCSAALERAGFREVATRPLDLRWRLESPDDLFWAFHRGTARTGALLRGQDGEARDRIAEAVRDAAAGFAAPEGWVEVPMPALLAHARKPLGAS
jgi:ubiquinone/menaquinone biosynthesis C-methylase UbiE